jgi:hypothetical protein
LFGALLMLLSLSAACCAPVGAGGPYKGGGGGPQGGGSSNPPSRVGILEVSGSQVFVDGASAQKWPIDLERKPGDYRCRQQWPDRS